MHDSDPDGVTMEIRLSSILLGVVGIFFGLLALILPDLTLTTFFALFWVFLAIGIAVFLFLAITSRSDESMFWFGLSAVLLVIGAFSFFIPGIVSLLFILAIAGIAAYSGYANIIITLSHEKSKYYVIIGMLASGLILLFVLLRYFPSVSNNLVLTIVGNFALVFGIFSLVLAWYAAYDE